MVAGAKQIPRTHGEANSGADVTTATDVEISWEQSGHVGASRDGVGGNVGAELCQSEGGRDNEDTEALARVCAVEEVREEVERIPDGRSVDDTR